MKTVYIADLDGTLLDNSGKVSARTVEIINSLIKQGLLFSVATARSVATVKTLLSDLNLPLPVVLMNGVFFSDLKTGKTIKCFPFKNETAAKIIEIFEKHNRYPFMYLNGEEGLEAQYIRLDNATCEAFVAERSALYHKSFDKVARFTAKAGKEIVYFTFLDLYENLKEIYDEVSRLPGVKCAFYHDTYSENMFFEILSADAGKNTGVLTLKEYAKADSIVVFGDNLNDIPMFEVADEAYAMANAVDELKKIANGVISTNQEDGVAEFLKENFEYGIKED